VETLDPANPDRYRYKGQWKAMEVEHQKIGVRGRAEAVPVELRYTVHGPVIHLDKAANRAYALRWVGTEPGTAGYLAGIALSRAQNWREFTASISRYKVPSENIVYADTAGNIGWHATGLTPVRKNWNGLLPVPGASGEYEWSGFLPAADLPHLYNPPAHYVATANHNILPAGYPHALGYEWAPPFRFERIREMIAAGRKFTIADFERMQHDVTSVAARRFQELLKGFQPAGAREKRAAELVRSWDARMSADSPAALIYAMWVTRLPLAAYGQKLGAQVDVPALLRAFQSKPDPKALEASLSETLKLLEQRLGADMSRWQWGSIHQIHFRHPLDRAEFNRGPFPRSGDATTVMAASGANFMQANGASYRQILDVADWDRSVMTNVPGESGDPSSPHYSDLIADWLAGKYHPMPYSRKAVEAAAEERILLEPK
jgi:penicillin amidase